MDLKLQHRQQQLMLYLMAIDDQFGSHFLKSFGV